MAHPPVDDPLVVMSVRVPRSMRTRLHGRASEAGVSLSDVFRTFIQHTQVTPLGKPVPRRRQPKKLGRVTGIDPVLLRQLNAISNNINQLARKANTTGIRPGDVVSMLTNLTVIGREMELIRRAVKAKHGSY